MIKRQQRIHWITAVLQEYLAASTASDLLTDQTRTNPEYGWDKGWEPRAGQAFADNLDATYILRIYAEFEAAIRDYWLTYLGHTTRPPMFQLVNTAIPNQRFSRDVIEKADEVREYRNSLVHDPEDLSGSGTSRFTLHEAKRHLCTYLSRLDPEWR